MAIRILSVSSAATLVVVALVGCGDSARTPPVDSQQADAGEERDAPGETSPDGEAVIDASDEPPPLDVEVLPPVVSDCPSRDGMVGARLKGGDCFLIDARLVTKGDYYDALQRGDLRPASDPACAEVEGFGPRLDQDHRSLCGGLPNIGEEPPYFRWPPPTEYGRAVPMACLNWCDALSYCESQGKRLCRGGRDDDGRVTVDSLNDAARDEWFSACTGGGTRKYPYGDTRLSQEQCRAHREICNEGGYAGLYEMEGATSYRRSIVDNCDAESDVCIFRGRAWGDDPNCKVNAMEKSKLSRFDYDFYVSFRCCADS